MANWWDEAYSDITKWSVNADQLNKDRGSYKDAFQMNTAEKGLNYDLTSKLMNQSTDQEKSMVQLSADLDRRNTLDLMTGEHNFKVAGMQESNRLSKDYLASEGFQTRETLAEQGFQDRASKQVTNQGTYAVAREQRGAAENVASTNAAAERYGAEQQRAAAEGVAGTQAGAQRYGADRNLDMANTQAASERYGADQQRYGAQDVANTQAGAQRYGADRNLDMANTQAASERYGADQQRAAAEGVAGTQAGAQRYGADRNLDVANAQAFAERYVSDQQRQGAENVAGTQAQAQRDISRTEGDTARDVAGIQGGYGLRSVETQDRGETARTAMNLGSQERQIGLSGNESRRTIETQGEQSRRNIETEGDQSRQNIRTTGGVERKTYSYQRDTDADRAVRMSRR